MRKLRSNIDTLLKLIRLNLFILFQQIAMFSICLERQEFEKQVTFS